MVGDAKGLYQFVAAKQTLVWVLRLDWLIGWGRGLVHHVFQHFSQDLSGDVDGGAIGLLLTLHSG